MNDNDFTRETIVFVFELRTLYLVISDENKQNQINQKT